MTDILRKKILAILLALFLSVMILEGVLRLSGFILLSIQNYQNHLSLGKRDIVRILCLGESTTYIGGEDSYPSQLENILNTALPKKSFKVINKGVPGTSSQIILDNVDAWINEFQPDIVVVMMGINDLRDLIPFHKQPVYKKIQSWLKNLRIVKLAGWLKNSYQNKFFSSVHILPTENNPPESKESPADKTVGGQESGDLPKKYLQFYIESQKFRAKGEYKKAEILLQELISKGFQDRWRRLFYIDLAKIYMAQNRYEDFAGLLKGPLPPHDYWIKDQLTFLCRQASSSFILLDALEDIMTRNADNFHYYEILGGCYQDAGRIEKARLNFTKAKNMRLKKINLFTQTYYRELLEKLRVRNIRAVLVQYPLEDVRNLEVLFYETKYFHDLVFVDNEKSFQPALEEGKYHDYFTDRFAGKFGHCTPLGNRMIAQNVADVILNKIFEIPKR